MNAFLGFPAILAFAPHACGIPRFAIVLYYLYSGMPPTQVIRKASYVHPVPLGGLVGQEGGCTNLKTGFLQSSKKP